jgi:hypothetical protein
MALHAQKDMVWSEALKSDRAGEVVAALEKEMASLQETILTQVTPDDADYAEAVSKATPGRFLLDLKRSDKYKVRGVKQGCRENREQADGQGFNYMRMLQS